MPDLISGLKKLVMLFQVLFHTFYIQFKGAFLVSASLRSVCYDTVVYYIRAPSHKLYRFRRLSWISASFDVTWSRRETKGTLYLMKHKAPNVFLSFRVVFSVFY